MFLSDDKEYVPLEFISPYSRAERYLSEMEAYLRECGFKSISTYSNYKKEPAVDDQCEMLIFECDI